MKAKYTSGLLKWQGGKRSLLQYIFPRFPKKFKTYVEVFGGAGAVLLNYQFSGCKVIYNDFNQDLVNLFNVVKNRPAEFIRAVGIYNLNSRVEFLAFKSLMNNMPVPLECVQENVKLMKEMMDHKQADELVDQYKTDMLDTELRNAVLFFKRYSYSFAAAGNTWNVQPSTIVDIASRMHRFSEKLKNVAIECGSYERIIEARDSEETFFYCDPPYFNTEDYYEADFNKDNHEHLRDTLANIQGKFLLSYNDCPEIRELYQDFNIVEIERPNSISRIAGSVYRELLIANYDIINVFANNVYEQKKLNLYGEDEDEWNTIL